MENASKALLIAGSILIVILLIAVGVRIFNSTTGTTDAAKTTMDATAIASFNNKFMSYVGKNKSKAQAISLINQMIINNSSDSNPRVYLSFSISPTVSTSLYNVNDLSTIINQTGSTYEEKFTNKTSFNISVKYDEKGYVQIIQLL